jgi:hypothetical protein
MNAHAGRREIRALVKAWSRSVFADRERVGAVHRADPIVATSRQFETLGSWGTAPHSADWLAVDANGRIIGAFAEEATAVHAVLNAARRRS